MPPPDSITVKFPERRQDTLHPYSPALLLSLLLIMATATPAVCRANTGSSEPGVSNREAALISRTMDVASTNIIAAIRLLEPRALPDASPALDFVLGNLYLRSDQLAAAASFYESAIEKMPSFLRASANLVRVYIRQENTAAAIEQCQQLLRDGHTDGDILLLLGHALSIAGHEVSAEHAYRQTLMLKADDPDAMAGIARCLLVQKRYHEALALLTDLSATVPDRHELWDLRAQVCIALGQATNAIVCIETGRRIGAPSSGMLATLGDLYINAMQPDLALGAYEEAFSSGPPSFSRILRAAEGFLMLNSPAYAEQMLERIDPAIQPAEQSLETNLRSRLMNCRARIALLKEEPGTAMEICRRLLKHDPLDAGALIMLGDLCQKDGRIEEAVLAYERASRLPGNEAKALIRQANLEIQRDRYRIAAQLLERALAFNPQPELERYCRQIRRMADQSE